MPQKDLILLDITNPQDPRLPEFYELYGKVFTLPEEREPIEGFRTVLGLTADPAVARDFGPISERITLAIDPATGKVIGATNYIYYGYGEAWTEYGAAASCQLNFICVDPKHRGRGVAPRLLRDMEEKLAIFAEGAVPASRGFLFVTCEQNNPARMTKDQLAADIRDSGMDPNARLAWWVRQGYRRLDFAYRQPPLNPGQDACAYLDYYVRFPDGRDRPGLPAALLAEHLRRFFFVSVGKLQVDMQANPEWRLQQGDLAARDTVAVVPSR
jgi:GNAT superfamily N-acetyltransferase